MAAARCEVASRLVDDLSKKETLRSLVQSTKHLLLANINLANEGVNEFIAMKQLKGIAFKSLQGRNVKPFHECMSEVTEELPGVLTVSHTLRRDKNYSDHIVRVHKYSPSFSISESGISRPKFVECVGTNGVFYKQIVKGNDDMRQDAVIQQVFIVDLPLFSNYFLLFVNFY